MNFIKDKLFRRQARNRKKRPNVHSASPGRSGILISDGRSLWAFEFNKWRNVISSTRSMSTEEIERKATISREKCGAADFATTSYDFVAIIVARFQLHASFHETCCNSSPLGSHGSALYCSTDYIYGFVCHLFCIKFKSFSYAFITTQRVFLWQHRYSTCANIFVPGYYNDPRKGETHPVYRQKSIPGILLRSPRDVRVVSVYYCSVTSRIWMRRGNMYICV